MKTFQKLTGSIRKFYIPIISVSLVILTISIVYWQDLAILINEAVQNEAVSHIILVPLLASFLIYRKRELVKASLNMKRLKGKAEVLSSSEVTGLAICLFAFILYWYGSYSFYPLEYHIASLITFVIGITLLLFNTKTLMALILPILFLIFLIPPPSTVTFSLGALLGNFNAQATYTLLKIAGIPIALSSKYGPPTIIINNLEQPLEFAVDLPCSGIYSIVAFTMFAAFLMYVIHGSFTKKIALIALGFLMLPILNILRISLIVSVAYGFGEATAMTLFHILSGWLLIFIGILLILIIAEKLLHLQIFGSTNKTVLFPTCDHNQKDTQDFCPKCGKFHKSRQTGLPKRFWIKITALLLASYLVTLSIQAPAFAFAQGLTIGNPETSTEVFPEVADYQLKFLYRDHNFEKISRQDASLLYAYISQNISNPTIYVLVGVASSITNLHSWEVCLVTWQQAHGNWPLVNVLKSKDIQIMQNPPITARYFVFEHPDNYTQVTLYWYQKALFKTGLTIEPRYTRISLIILTKTLDNSFQLEQKLLSMGQSITTYWEPLKAQSLISLGIPTMQVLLASTILFAVIIQTTQYTGKWKIKKTNLKIFEKLGSPEEKQLYQTLKELSQKIRETTTQNIASAFEKATGKAVKLNDLIKMLDNLEKHGIINADLINILDEPRLVWKS